MRLVKCLYHASESSLEALSFSHWTPRPHTQDALDRLLPFHIFGGSLDDFDNIRDDQMRSGGGITTVSGDYVSRATNDQMKRLSAEFRDLSRSVELLAQRDEMPLAFCSATSSSPSATAASGVNFDGAYRGALESCALRTIRDDAEKLQLEINAIERQRAANAAVTGATGAVGIGVGGAGVRSGDQVSAGLVGRTGMGTMVGGQGVRPMLPKVAATATSSAMGGVGVGTSQGMPAGGVRPPGVPGTGASQQQPNLMQLLNPQQQQYLMLLMRTNPVEANRQLQQFLAHYQAQQKR